MLPELWVGVRSSFFPLFFFSSDRTISDRTFLHTCRLIADRSDEEALSGRIAVRAG